MTRFSYTAMNEKGIEVAGVIDAEDTLSAISQIRELGHFPTSVTRAAIKHRAPGSPARAVKARFAQIGFLTRKSVKPKVLAIFTRQLAALIDAGLPLLKSLHVLESQQRSGPLRDALARISEKVETGSTFSEALSHHPRIFNNLFVNMVKAGEAGGVLEQVLNRLAEFLEKQEKLRSRVKSAMIYPAVVVTVAVGVVTFLMAFVVPRLKEVFDSFTVPLPPTTRALMRIGTLARDHLWYSQFPYVGALAVLPIMVVIGFNLFKKSPRGKAILDSARLSFPILGNLLRSIAVARFSRTLGTLMRSGVPILEALNIVRDTSGNEVVAKAITTVHNAVREGESIGNPLRATRVFNPVFVSMIEVGEETGKLPEMLMKIADDYDEDVDNAVAGISSVIEPILIVFLAFVVGFIAIAMFVPLIELVRRFGEGGREA